MQVNADFNGCTAGFPASTAKFARLTWERGFSPPPNRGNAIAHLLSGCSRCLTSKTGRFEVALLCSTPRRASAARRDPANYRVGKESSGKLWRRSRPELGWESVKGMLDQLLDTNEPVFASPGKVGQTVCGSYRCQRCPDVSGYKGEGFTGSSIKSAKRGTPLPQSCHSPACPNCIVRDWLCLAE